MHNPKKFLKTRIWTLQLLQAKARGSGATLSECNFYKKIAPTEKELRATKKTKGTLWLLVPTSKRLGGYTH